jgi:predicted MFS family arabinose efflux permease
MRLINWARFHARWGEATSSLREYRREVWLISAAAALASGAFLGMMQLLKTLYVLRLGYGPEFVGTMFAVGALSFASASVPGGALGARFGTRRIMIVGAITMVLGMALFPLTEWAPQGMRTAWVYLGQVVSSSGWSMFIVNQIPALMAFTTVENRKHAYAVKEACAGLGQFLGAFVGGLLPGTFAGLLHITTAEPAPYRYGLVVSIALAATSLVPMALIGPVQVSRRARRARRSRPLLLPLTLLAGCAFFNNGAVASCKAFASAYLDREFGLPTSLIGTIASVGLCLSILSALSGPRLARRRGSGNTMMIASLTLALVLLQMSLIPHWIAVGIGYVGMLALSAMWRPAYQVLQMEMADPAWRSLMSGAGAMAMSLGFGSMSFSGGYIVAAVGYRRVFLIGVGLSAMSAALMSILLRRLERQPATDASTPANAPDARDLPARRQREIGQEGAAQIGQ